MLVFFKNLSFMEFKVRYLALFCLFSVIDSFRLFGTRSLQKTVLLMLELLKAIFLVLHFSHYTLMTFLMILSVILLSMLMILLSTLSVIRYLMCDKSQNWLLILNPIYKMLWSGGGSGLCNLMLGKLNWFWLPGNTGAIDVKMGGSVLDEK